MGSSASTSPAIATTTAPTTTPAVAPAVGATTTSTTTTSTSTTPTTATTNPTNPVSSPSSPSTTSTTTKPTTGVTTLTTPTTTTPAATQKPSTPSVSLITETSDGQVFTQTAVVTIPTSTTPTQTPSNQSSPSFFHNTGEVAGVFSVVGVVALVIIFFFFTSYIRKRRARQLDREIDEAAAAAAAAHAPDFDDYDYNSGGGGFGHYSETSHGTFNQPPLSHESPLNNLGDMPTSYEAYGGGGRGGAGAAGIGARGRSQRGGGQPDPYGAFANPPEQYEMYETRRSWHQGIPHGGQGPATYDLLQAAGMVGSDPYAVARKASTGMLMNRSHPGVGGLVRSHSQDASATLATTESHPGIGGLVRSHSQDASAALGIMENHPGIGGLVRSHSPGASAMLTTTESHSMPTPAPGYPGGQDTPYPPEKARHSASYGPGGGISIMPPDDDEDAYDGYHNQPSLTLDNPHSPARTNEDILDEVTGQFEDAPHPRVDEEPARASIADDEDYGYNSGRGMLRVANE